MRSLANIITHVTIAIFNFRKRQKMMWRSKLQLVYFKGIEQDRKCLKAQAIHHYSWQMMPSLASFWSFHRDFSRWYLCWREFHFSISVHFVSSVLCKTSYGTKTWEELKLKYLLILNFPWIYYGSEQVGSKLLFSVLHQSPHKNYKFIDHCVTINVSVRSDLWTVLSHLIGVAWAVNSSG